jgi:hypothetical protein
MFLQLNLNLSLNQNLNLKMMIVMMRIIDMVVATVNLFALLLLLAHILSKLIQAPLASVTMIMTTKMKSKQVNPDFFTENFYHSS